MTVACEDAPRIRGQVSTRFLRRNFRQSTKRVKGSPKDAVIRVLELTG